MVSGHRYRGLLPLGVRVFLALGCYLSRFDKGPCGGKKAATMSSGKYLTNNRNNNLNSNRNSRSSRVNRNSNRSSKIIVIARLLGIGKIK